MEFERKLQITKDLINNTRIFHRKLVCDSDNNTGVKQQLGFIFAFLRTIYIFLSNLKKNTNLSKHRSFTNTGKPTQFLYILVDFLPFLLGKYS